MLKGAVYFFADLCKNITTPIMIDFARLSSYRNGTTSGEMELIARRTIAELEGDEGLKHIDEYLDSSSERGKRLRNTICEQFKFSSLDFQSLEGIIEAIGLPECKLCTYCRTGKE